MKRAMITAVAGFGLCLSGCAKDQPFFPPGTSPDELTSTIASEGRGEGSQKVAPQPQPGGLLAPNASSSPMPLSQPGVGASIMGR
jgi:hypothetical protein